MEHSKIVYVVGHKNPDTDSTCAAIAYSHFKNLTDKRFLFTPGRAGKLNEETRFVLERFGVPIPNEIESFTPTVSDLDMKRPVFIHMRESVQALAELMKNTGVRSVPVVDDEGRLAGIVGLRDIAQHYMDSVGFTDLSKAPIELDILVKTLNCRVITNSRNISVLTGKVLVSALQKGTILNMAPPGAVVIAGDQRDIQLELIHAACSALIITDRLPVDRDIITEAEQKGTLILSSPHNAFGTLQLLTMSEPVGSIMSTDCPTAGLFTHIASIRKQLRESDYRSSIVIDSDNRLIGFITRTDLLDPVRKRAILVDHNEIS
jgi:manganese-dependent inorganic pyrophosphatase